MTRLRGFAAFLFAVFTILAVPFAARAQPFAYVPNLGDSSLSVFDVTHSNATATVGIPFGGPIVVVNSAGNRVYVSGTSARISVLETTTNSQMPSFLALSAGGYGPVKGMALDETVTPRLWV